MNKEKLQQQRDVAAILRARRQFKTAGQRVIAKVKKAFPIGACVKVQINANRVIYGTVASHPWNPTDCETLVINNGRTGKNHHHHVGDVELDPNKTVRDQRFPS